MNKIQAMANLIRCASAGRLIVVLPVILLAGCATVTLDGGREKPKVRASTTISSSRIDMLMPKVRRTGPTTADISFDIVGDFEITEVLTTPGEVTGGHQAAIGFFPGAAPSDDALGRIGTAFKAVWYNVCFFGTPTLAGLFVGPFAENQTSTFSRSALLGVYKWSTMEKKSPDHVDRFTRNEKSIPLGNVDIIVSGYQSTKQNGGVSISGLQPGRQIVNVSLSVNYGHTLADKLKNYQRGTIQVVVPAEEKQ